MKKTEGVQSAEAFGQGGLVSATPKQENRSMNPQTFTAQNPRFNATLDRAHQIQADLISQGISKNPRIYANQYTLDGAKIPEHSDQDNSDLPGWATVNYDGSTTLDSMIADGSLTTAQACSYELLVAEAPEGPNGDDNFCNVAQIDLEMTNDSKTLAQAVGVSQ